MLLSVAKDFFRLIRRGLRARRFTNGFTIDRQRIRSCGLRTVGPHQSRRSSLSVALKASAAAARRSITSSDTSKRMACFLSVTCGSTMAKMLASRTPTGSRAVTEDRAEQAAAAAAANYAARLSARVRLRLANGVDGGRMGSTSERTLRRRIMRIVRSARYHAIERAEQQRESQP